MKNKYESKLLYGIIFLIVSVMFFLSSFYALSYDFKLSEVIFILLLSLNGLSIMIWTFLLLSLYCFLVYAMYRLRFSVATKKGVKKTASIIEVTDIHHGYTKWPSSVLTVKTDEGEIFKSVEYTDIIPFRYCEVYIYKNKVFMDNFRW